MIYDKVAFETTDCLCPCIERFLHRGNDRIRYDMTDNNFKRLL
jgi:hypothetical protein